MNLLLAVVIGILYACGLYLMVRRSIVKLLIGLSLLGHASNLLVLVAGGLTRGRSPLIRPGADALVPPYADPLPQALILTAIVIGFGVLAFAVVMVHKTYAAVGTDDLNQMRSTDA